MSQNLSTLTFKVIAGAIVALLLIELALRALPVYDVRRVADDGALTHLQPGTAYTYSKGWRFINARHGVTNTQGFNVPYDYRPSGHDVAVIGDSFVQALMLAPRATLSAHLGSGNRPALVLADGGYSMADYLVAARVATRDYGVKKLVVVIVNGDLDEAFSDTYRGKNAFTLTDHGIEVRKSRRKLSARESLMKQLSSHSRLVGYLAQNLVLQAQLPRMFDGIVNRFAANAETPRSERNVERYRRTSEYFLQRIVADTGLAPADIALIFDADRPNIYRHVAPELDPREERFKTTAVATGFAVVDLNQIFAHDYAQYTRRFDFSPEDGHWNEYGHYRVAQAARVALNLD